MLPKSQIRYDVIRTDLRYNDPYTIMREVSEQELKKVYSMLRSTFNKRIDRILESEFGRNPEYQSARHAYPSVKGQSLSDLAYRTSQLLRRLDQPTYSLTGLKESRRRTVQSLNLLGLHNVNESNIAQFGEFMDYVRSVVEWSLLASDEVVKLIDDYLGERGDSANVAEWSRMFEHYLGFKETTGKSGSSGFNP